MHKRGEIIRRFIKVVYFLITIPCLGFLIFILKGEYEITKYYGEGGFMFSTYKVLNRWKYMILLGVLVLGFILLTDLLRRIVSYITKGDFSGFIPYKKIFIDFWGWISIGIAVFVSIYSIGNWYENHIISYCTSEGESLSSNGVCGCNEIAELVDGKCKIKEDVLLSGLISNYLASKNFFVVLSSFLNDSKEKKIAFVIDQVDSKSIPDKFFNVFSDKELEVLKLDSLHNYIGFDKNCNSISDKAIKGIDGLVGKGYFFTFIKRDNKRKIDFVSEVPQYYSSSILRYPEYVQKDDYFNWKDIDNDGMYKEFFLQNCHGTHLLVGYDTDKNQIFYYSFVEDVDNINLWRNFFQNPEIEFRNGKYHHQIACNPELGIVSYVAWDWMYNPKKKIFEMTNYVNKFCTSKDD